MCLRNVMFYRDFVSPSILKVELGIEEEMTKLDEKFKVRLARMPILGNLLSIVSDKFANKSLNYGAMSSDRIPMSTLVGSSYELLKTINRQCNVDRKSCSHQSGSSP